MSAYLSESLSHWDHPSAPCPCWMEEEEEEANIIIITIVPRARAFQSVQKEEGRVGVMKRVEELFVEGEGEGVGGDFWRQRVATDDLAGTASESELYCVGKSNEDTTRSVLSLLLTGGFITIYLGQRHAPSLGFAWLYFLLIQQEPKITKVTERKTSQWQIVERGWWPREGNEAMEWKGHVFIRPLLLLLVTLGLSRLHGLQMRQN